MLRTKIKVSSINNLTDARYFAAWGADYLGFSCNEESELYCTPEKIREILDWIEGPECVLEFSGWQEKTEIERLIEQFECSCLHFESFAQNTARFNLPIFQDVFCEKMDASDIKNIDFPVIRSEKKFMALNQDDLFNIQNIMTHHQCFIDIEFQSSELEEMLSILPSYGIILRGGSEEKPGFKSFEQLDEIFEILSS